MERDSLLRQADHMWKMLDNMAENNPEGYQCFIKKQLQEGSAHFKPPEPVFCLSCEIDEATPASALLYINICQWCQVPKPKTDNDAIPVKGGMLRKSDTTTYIYDVAFNPAIIEESVRQDLNEQLIQLILDYTIDMTKLNLKKNSCKKLDKKFVGPVQDIVSSIDERHRSSIHDSSNINADHPQFLLDQLASINKQTVEESNIILPNESVKETVSSKKLIEELSTDDKHNLQYRIDADKENLLVTILVGKDAESIAEAELDVSENELELKIPGVPDCLLVKLPRLVDKDTTVAKYQPKTGQLFVTMTYNHV